MTGRVSYRIFGLGGGGESQVPPPLYETLTGKLQLKFQQKYAKFGILPYMEVLKRHIVRLIHT